MPEPGSFSALNAPPTLPEIRSVQLATPSASGDAGTALSLPRTQLASFGEDAEGHLYVVALASPGAVYRIDGP